MPCTNKLADLKSKAADAISRNKLKIIMNLNLLDWEKMYKLQNNIYKIKKVIRKNYRPTLTKIFNNKK